MLTEPHWKAHADISCQELCLNPAIGKPNHQAILCLARPLSCQQCMPAECLHPSLHRSRSCKLLSSRSFRGACTRAICPTTCKATRRDLLLLSTGQAFVGLQQVNDKFLLQMHMHRVL